MEFTIEFYIDKQGKKPVEVFLKGVLKKNRSLWARAIAGLEKIKHKSYHREPLSKFLERDLWEIRIKSRNSILRIIYTFAKERKIVLLHGLIKKTRKTPKKELEIARRRLKEFK